MSEQHLNYAKRIPKEVRLAIDGLSGKNETGYAIMVLLVENDPMRFKQIEEKLDLHPQKITNALGELEKGGVVEKRAGDKIGKQSTGKYAITKFGDQLLDGLYEATQPDSKLGTGRSLSEPLEKLLQEHLHAASSGSGKIKNSTFEDMQIKKQINRGYKKETDALRIDKINTSQTDRMNPKKSDDNEHNRSGLDTPPAEAT